MRVQPFTPIDWRRLLRAMPSVPVWAFALLVAGASYGLLPTGGYDWRNDIGPAARNWLHPGAEGLPLLPWSALLLSPLGTLPDSAATALVNGASVLALAVVVRSLGGRDWLAIPLLASPFGFWLFGNGQTDILILTGLLFFNGLDPLILALKPQLALGVVVARVRRAGPHWPRYLAPFAVVLALSFVVWPGWPLFILNTAQVVMPGTWNASLWPWGVPAGLALLWRTWQTGDDRWGLAATPLLSPYVNGATWLGLLTVLAVRWPRWFMTAWLIGMGGLAWQLTMTLATGLLHAAGLALAVGLIVAAGASIGGEMLRRLAARTRPPAKPAG